jgi:DNA topoisomerase-1
MARGLSAGRVQSIAMRLLVERERERIRFKRAIYWDLSAIFAPLKNTLPVAVNEFEAMLVSIAGKKIAQGKDFDPLTGRLVNDKECLVLDEKSAHALREKLIAQEAEVISVEEKPITLRPYPPFTTSTLQQEASSKLGFAARRTMQVAQQLYENGFITYMRTDSTSLSDEALKAARSLIAVEFGKENLPDQHREYKTKVKNAQEAHEAIRPAGASFTPMQEVANKLGGDAFRLYELIWKRTVASQMKDAEGKRVALSIRCDDVEFRATGRTITFPGFLRAYVAGSDDPESDLAERDKILPTLQEGDKLKFNKLDPLSHETQPPARYTEGTLIKELERLGIGRPSTWATVVDLVLNRQYAFKKGQALVPTYLAGALTRLMERYFTQLLDYEFTARLEDDLDAISRGEADSLDYLRRFYNGNGHAGLDALVKEGEEKIDPRDVCGIPLDFCAFIDLQGKNKDLVRDTPNNLEVRIGRYGPFLSDGTTRAGMPDGIAPDEVTQEMARTLLAEAAKGPQSLGLDPATNLPVYVKKGRFGPYVQLGDGSPQDDEKPKMASLLRGQAPEEITLDVALQLLSLPRELGINPNNGEKIFAANGRFGPYIKCGSDTRSISVDQASPLSITLEKALELLSHPKTRGRGAAATPKVVKELGESPDSKRKITIRDGRYGPYVTDGETNASIPQGTEIDAVSLELAVSLLEARAAMPKRTKKKRVAKKR